MIPYVLTASEDEEQVARGVPDVKVLQVARVYAEALLNACEKDGQVDEVLGEFETLINLTEAPRSDLRRFFASGVIGRRTREEVIKKSFEGRAHPLLVNLLLVVNDHERTTLLPAILFQARQLRDERARRLPVYIHVAVNPSDDQVDRVRQRVRDALQVEPLVEVKVEPELLGGLMLRVGDHVFDGTVRTKLKQIRDQLISRSSHEIQSGRDRFSSAE
jgi:F-type H+-transporting ATPase subunit delta